MLWLARALENIPPDSPGLDRAVRAEPGRLACRGEADGTHPHARRRGPRRGVQPRRAEPGDRVRRSDGAALGRRQGRAALRPDEPRGGRPRRRLQPGRDDARHVAATAGCADGTPSPGLVGVAIRHEAPVTAVRFSPDGSTIATASRADLPASGTPRPGMRSTGVAGRHDAQVLAIAFHPDGTLLAAAGDDGRSGSGRPRPGGCSTRRSGTRRPSALAFGPDGRTLLTGCRDGRARLWDLRRWAAPGGVRSIGAEVGCVAFGPDGPVGRDGVPRRDRPALGCRDGQTDRRAAGAPGAGRLPGVPSRRVDRRDGQPRRDRPGSGMPAPACRSARPWSIAAPCTTWHSAPTAVGWRRPAPTAMARCWRVPAPIAGDRRADRLLGPRRDRARIRRGRRDPPHGPTGPLGAPPPPPGPGRAAGQQAVGSLVGCSEASRVGETRRTACESRRSVGFTYQWRTMNTRASLGVETVPGGMPTSSWAWMQGRGDPCPRRRGHATQSTIPWRKDRCLNPCAPAPICLGNPMPEAPLHHRRTDP